MDQPIPITEKAFWIGVNDRTTDLFESLWPIPLGVSYNSYVLLDDKVAVIDTVKKNFFAPYLEKLKIALNGRKVDYLIANHLEPDHSGSYKLLREVFPEAKIVGNAKTMAFLKELYDIPDNLVTIEEGDVLDLGTQKLTFVTVPMVHWPESMVTYETTTQTLFSNDAFGSFGALEGGIFDDEQDLAYIENETLRYFSNIVGRYTSMVQKAFGKLGGVPVKIIAPSHGAIWRNDPPHIMGLYDKWSKLDADEGIVIARASMYGNSEKMLEAVSSGIVSENFHTVRVYDVARTHPSYIIRDCFRYKGLVLGGPTYDAGMFPPMDHLTRLLAMKKLKNRIVGVFGNYGWQGVAVKSLCEFAEGQKLDLVEPVVEAHFAPNADDLNRCREMGRNIAKAVRAACQTAEA